MALIGKVNAGSADRVFWTLIGGGVLAVIAAGAIVFWLATEFNRSARIATAQLIENSIAETLNGLGHTARTYALWRITAATLGSRNETAVRMNVGTAATERGTFDMLYFVDGDGKPVYGYRRGDVKSTLEHFPARTLSQLVNRTFDQNAGGVYTIGRGIDWINGRLVLVVAAPVRVDGSTRPVDGRPHLMLAGHFIDGAWTRRVASKLGVENVRVLYGAVSADPPGRSSLPLRNAQNTVTATLTWDAPDPGFAAVMRASPVILLICLVLLGGAALAAFTCRRLVKVIMEERQSARVDSMTGLLNRSGLEHALQQQATQDALADGQLAVLYLDLNNFKQLNDTEGHAAGDLALQRVARTLKRALRSGDHAARVGGDEFICLLIDRDPRSAANSVSRRIVDACAAPLRFDESHYLVMPAIGVAIASEADTWISLVRRADEKMYQAKAEARAAREAYDLSA